MSRWRNFSKKNRGFVMTGKRNVVVCSVLVPLTCIVSRLKLLRFPRSLVVLIILVLLKMSFVHCSMIFVAITVRQKWLLEREYPGNEVVLFLALLAVQYWRHLGGLLRVSNSREVCHTKWRPNSMHNQSKFARLQLVIGSKEFVYITSILNLKIE